MREFKTADAIRDELNELGVTVEDVQGKTIWHEKQQSMEAEEA